MSEDIAEYLIENFGFIRIIKGRVKEVDIDQFTCVRRVHEIHYLYWSEVHKHFSIAVHHENPKGLAGGGTQHITSIMLPKTIYTIEEAVLLINGIVNFNYLKVMV